MGCGASKDEDGTAEIEVPDEAPDAAPDAAPDVAPEDGAVAVAHPTGTFDSSAHGAPVAATPAAAAAGPKWACPACTLENDLGASKCGACSAARGGAPPPPTSSSGSPADEGKTFIGKEELGPETSLMERVQPDWRFELERGNWRSYSLEESMTLDIYWKVFRQRTEQGGRPSQACLAKVMLMKRMADVDFAQMTCSVGTSKPRKLERQEKDAGWLDNQFFWEAFKGALAASGQSAGSGRAEDVFNFRFNQDFRDKQDDGRPLHRGGQRYELPIGWKRFAVHVLGRYDDGDNTWLGENESGWAVAYHGTSGAGLAGILSSGFQVGARQRFADSVGAGIYCTPELPVAQHYSQPQMQEGRSVQIVLQLRVRPQAIKPISDSKATDFEKKYWVINNGEDIRAYGVLIRELAVKDYVCPEEMVFGKDHPATKKAYASLK